MPEPSRSLVEQLAHRLQAQVVETHISWVLLLDELAYKLKKPVRLPFVDYSTPERRRHFCAEEVRLNQRLAPTLYLGVSRITGPPAAPGIDGAGETLDYAVRMRRFPAGALFSEQVAAGTLAPAAVDRLAGLLAGFHLAAPACTGALAADQSLAARALAALEGARPLLPAHAQAALCDWVERQWARVGPLWTARRAGGHAREGHGDLHLANILEFEGEVAAFDGVEFDAALRCIDVIEDVAFTLMDFAARGQAPLGWRFLNAWLERTGEYEGLPGLRLCLAYRALVRAMAEHLRAPGSAAARHYARQALQWSAPPQPRLVITHGLPGSGKTFASRQWLQRTGAIRLRSDVERKRMHGLPPLADSASSGMALYTPQATQRTYQRLFDLAGLLLAAGLPVVLDAAFLRREERRQAQEVARRAGAPFSILACEAPLAVLHERLRSRSGDASEADGAVLERLSRQVEPLAGHELACVICPPAASAGPPSGPGGATD